MTFKSCEIKNPLVHPGTSQRERLLQALLPESIKVDEKNTDDLIVFAAKYAEEIIFYQADNTINGTWVEFIEQDLSTALSQISIKDVDEARTAFNQTQQQVLALGNGVGLDALFQVIVDQAFVVDTWLKGTRDASTLNVRIKEQIQNSLDSALQRVLSYDKGAENKFSGSHTTNSSIYPVAQDGKWSNAWTTTDPIADESIYSGVGNQEALENGLQKLNIEFARILNSQLLIIEDAKSALELTLTNWPDHQPHYGLLLVFLQIFKNAQDQINTLTARHLDFYYSEVLQILKKPEEADQVFLVFELAKNVNTHLVEAGTSFLAGEDESGEPIIFETTEDIVLNQAKVDQIKTIYTEFEAFDDPEVDSDNINIIYSADQANSVNGLGEEPFEANETWSLFGEPQKGKGEERRTMSDAQIGFAIASPILEMREGQRIITIQVLDENNGLSQANIKDIQADLLYSAKIEISGEEEWIEKKPIAVRVNRGNEDSAGTINITIKLDQDDPAVVPYQESVFEENFNTQWPVVKVTFTNNDLGVGPFAIITYSSNVSYSRGQVVLFEGVIYLCQAEPGQRISDARPDLNLDVWSPFERVEDYVYSEDTLSVIKEFDALELSYPKGSRVLSGGKTYLATNDLDARVSSNGEFLSRIPTPGTVENGVESWKLLDSPVFAYDILKDIRIQRVLLDVEVNNVSSVVLNSETARLDPNKPFLPFGNNQNVDSLFYIGDSEIFKKNLYELRIDVQWDGLPEVSFSKHYEAYEATPDNDGNFATSITNNSFLARIDILDGGNWKVLRDNVILFETLNAIEEEELLAYGSSALQPYSSTGDPRDLLFSEAATFAPKRTRSFLIRSIDELTDDEINISDIPRDPDLKEFRTFRQESAKGFIRVVLKRTLDNPSGSIESDNAYTNPSVIQTFGQQEFTPLFTERIINKTTLDDSVSESERPRTIPNDPYSPLIKSLKVSYKSTVTIDLTTSRQDVFESRVEQFFHLEPFGQREVHRQLLVFPEDVIGDEEIENIPLVPQFLEEGYLFLGLSGLTAPQTVSLLFQLQNGTNNPDVFLPEIQWQYLSANNWIDFGVTGITFNSTNGLITSGTISFNLPKEATNTDTRIGQGLTWLRGIVSESSDGFDKAITIQAQAITAQFVDNNNAPGRVAEGIPSESITSFVDSEPEVNTVSQPFASFGGRAEEEDEQYRVRVSERLRHRDRSVAIWDYERLVLEEFPSVYRAKCLNHTATRIELFQSQRALELIQNLRETTEYLESSLERQEALEAEERLRILLATETIEGNVTIVSVPKLVDGSSADLFAPKNNAVVLQEIEEYLSGLVSPFVNLTAENPIYERIELDFDVTLKEGFDQSFYVAVLENELKRFLTPWAFDLSKDIPFGGSIHRSELINFIDERPYVDYVHNFKLFQNIEVDGFLLRDRGENGEGLEEAVARTSRSILSSNETHTIRALNPEDIVPDSGVGNMVVNQTFIVR